MRADQTQWAAAKVAFGTLVVVGGLWLAFFAAGIDLDEGPVSAAPEAAEAPVSVEPWEIATEALARLEASIDSPPAGAIEDLLAVGEAVHLMMSAGEIGVSEDAVRALANTAPDDERVTELLDEIAFHAPDWWVRMRASQALLVRHDPLGIQAMLELLAVPQPVLLQLEGIAALREATGEDFGYDPEGDTASKGEALAQWRAWWTANASDPFVNARDITHR